MENLDLTRFLDVPLEIEALLAGPRMRVRDLLALRAGSVIETGLPAGENVEVLAGQAPLGPGELTASRGKVIVRMLQIRGSR
jgi:flagellar motor switch/type III secretory pathway protein FliN